MLIVHFIILNHPISPSTNPDELNAEISKFLQIFNRLQYLRPLRGTPQNLLLGPARENNNYEDAVVKALQAIKSGEISKIVLARKLTYQTKQELPYFSIAHGLKNKFPDCYTFCMTTPDNRMFIGSTPEILSKVSGISLETEAVAGTAPRGHSAGKDAHLGKTLLGREKEVREHRLVIYSMLRLLKSI